MNIKFGDNTFVDISCLESKCPDFFSCHENLVVEGYFIRSSVSLASVNIFMQYLKEGDLDFSALPGTILKEEEDLCDEFGCHDMRNLVLKEIDRRYSEEGVVKNLEHAAEYYKKSADQGNADGQCMYGACLYNGEGVVKNLECAAEYFRRSADQGSADAQYMYGECLEKGEGVVKNLELAAEYFMRSADQGYEQAQLVYNRLSLLRLNECYKSL